MSRRPKKNSRKRAQQEPEPARPAGIQAMDLKLYERVQQAVRKMASARAC